MDAGCARILLFFISFFPRILSFLVTTQFGEVVLEEELRSQLEVLWHPHTLQHTDSCDSFQCSVLDQENMLIPLVKGKYLRVTMCCILNFIFESSDLLYLVFWIWFSDPSAMESVGRLPLTQFSGVFDPIKVSLHQHRFRWLLTPTSKLVKALQQTTMSEKLMPSRWDRASWQL